MICCLLEFLAHLHFESFVCFFCLFLFSGLTLGVWRVVFVSSGIIFALGIVQKERCWEKSWNVFMNCCLFVFFGICFLKVLCVFLCLSMFCVHLGSLVCCLRFFGIVFLLGRRVCFIFEIEFEIRRRLHHLFLSDYFDAVLFLARNGGERFLDRSGGEKLILSIFLIYVDGVCVLKN